VLIASLLLSAAAATAVPPPAASPLPAEPVLARIRAAYTRTASVRVRFVQQYAPAGFSGTTPESGRLVLQAPASLRFEYDGSEGKVFTFDGTAARQYVAADKQMVVKTLTPAERARLPLLFLEEPRDLLVRYAVTAAPAPGGLTELTLVPKGSDEPRRLTLLADGSGEVRRLEILDGPGNRTSFAFTNREAGPARPASDFALVPPRGTKVVSGEPGGGKE
jgi:NAD+ synthase (glutamine-hydrolysing)/outer membrane lipoprotein carrier protein